MKVLFNITHGFQARMLLRTSIAPELRREGAEIVVVSPNANEPYFREEFEQAGYVVEDMPFRASKVEKAVTSTRAYLLMNPSLGRTLHYKRERYKQNYPWRHRATRAGNLVLGNVPFLRNAYLAAESAIFDGTEFDDLLRRHRPDLVIAGTPGFNVADAHILRAARRSHIATATVMLSWDNLTSKGYMAAQPDHLLVWNEIMQEQARHYHDYSGPVIQVGAAQFDLYREALDRNAGADFRAEHSIPENTKLVVWGTINQDIYPSQFEVLQEYARTLEKSDLDRVLWVRLHPQTVTGPHAHLAKVYQNLASEKVRVEIPPVRSSTLRWDLPRRDMHHLASLLQAADLVITPRSTLTIDSACAGTPVINLAIDRAFARGFDYTHYQHIVSSGGAWIVKSHQELLDATDRYLNEPQHHSEGRERIVREQMGEFYGRAGRRTAEALAAIATGDVRPDRKEP